MPETYDTYLDAIGAGHEAAQHGEHGKAEDAYRAALKLAEDDGETGGALHALAHLLINTGRPAESSPLWLQLAGLKDAPPVVLCEAHVAVGYEHEAAGRHDEALEAFAACKAVSGGMAQHRASACYHAAQVYFKLKRYAQARMELEAFEQIRGAYPEEKKQAPKLRKQIEKALG
jgi:tetratricopeptide (TPR) repeat protein